MYRFINPYNFVPMGDTGPAVKDKGDVYRGDIQKELMSGWLDVKMILKTPLMIPDGAHPKYYNLKSRRYADRREDVPDKKNLHLEYDFLKIYRPETGRKEYAVPGSELRGLIRSAYETVTNSCIPFMKDDKPMSQRIPLYGALTRRGLLGYDGKRWILYDTEKKLEEVLVIPVYEANGSYYAEPLDKVRANPDNMNKNKNFKYSIMKHLDEIEEKISLMKWKEKAIQCGAVFVKNDVDTRKWDIKINGERKETQIDKKIVAHLLVRENGSIVKENPGEFIKDKGWLQYNIPVNLSRVYHIAYLSRKEAVYTWEESTPRGDEDKEARQNDTCAEAYKKLHSAIVRDGAEVYGKDKRGGKKRENKQPNRKCNYALEAALEKACSDPEQLVPVYYFVVNSKCGNENNGRKELVYMSGSAIGRIAQRRKWKEIMKGHTPCTDKLCPACLLFGTIAEDGMKGHVRFTDAFMDSAESPECSMHTLQPLSSPRTTAFEFYLRKPTNHATYWNYDFYGITETEGENSHTNYYHLENAMPRGRKMYWHHSPSPDDSKKSNLNNTIQSIDKGEFSFKVFFDQITREQLTDLIWVITLGDNKESSTLQHHLGHAKPLGYGSVKLLINADKSKIRTFCKDADDSFRFETCKLVAKGIDVESISLTFDADTKTVRSFIKMCSADAVGEGQVDYPRTSRESKAIYEWFSRNRVNSKYLSVLPEPLENKLFLGHTEQRSEPKQSQKHDRDLLTVMLTKTQPDKTNAGMKVGFFHDGMVFGIPANVGAAKICVKVTKEKNGKKFCQYVETV